MQEMMAFIGRHPILSVVWVGLLGALIVSLVRGMFSKVKVISHNQMTQLINQENAIVVDVRSRDEFRQGHIIHAVNVQPNDIRAGNVGERLKNKAAPVIVVCASGTLSRAPAEDLVKHGFERVFILKDGMAGWRSENLPVVQGK